MILTRENFQVKGPTVDELSHMEAQEANASDVLSQKRLRNRLAQRKYRKNLKQRIEDLERRASSGADCHQPPDACTEVLLRSSGQRTFSISSTIRSPSPDSLRPSSPQHPSAVSSPQRQGVPSDPLHPRITKTSTSEELFNNDFQFSLSTVPIWQQVPGVPSEEIASLWLNQLNDFNDDVFDASTNTSTNIATHQQDRQTPLPINLADPTKVANSKDHYKAVPAIQNTTINSTLAVIIPAPEAAPEAMNSRKQEQSSRETSFNDILTTIQQAGYSSFDDAVLAYYTDQFDKGSAIYNAQKISRGRSLPSILRALRDSANDWSRWEATGYRDEVIKSAEIILDEELDRASKLIETRCLSQTPSEGAPVSAKFGHYRAGCADYSELEDSLPNLWALIFALTSAGSPPVRRARCQTLITIISALTAG